MRGMKTDTWYVTNALFAREAGVLVVIDGWHREIARLSPDALADARLVAAAPEMLAALEALVGEADLGEVDLGEEERAKLDRARAAIAKAKGEAEAPKPAKLDDETLVVACIVEDGEGKVAGWRVTMTWGEWRQHPDWGMHLTPEDIAEVELALNSRGSFRSSNNNVDGIWTVLLVAGGAR